MQICFIVSATKIISIKAFAHSFSVFSVMCHFTSLTINTCNLKTYHFWSVFVCATPSICQSVNLLPCRHSHWGLGRVRSESNLAAKTRRQFSLLVLATFLVVNTSLQELTRPYVTKGLEKLESGNFLGIT